MKIEKHICLIFSFFSNGKETVMETESKINLEKLFSLKELNGSSQNPSFSKISCVWAQLYLHSSPEPPNNNNV